MDTREVRQDSRGTVSRTPPRAADAPGDGHNVVLRGRQSATISGVRHVASFDEREIVLETELGALTVHGRDLQIKQLDLAAGTFWVEGVVDQLAYAASRGEGRGRGRQERGGMFGRLFR
jgi:sporulation protein YabP